VIRTGETELFLLETYDFSTNSLSEGFKAFNAMISGSQNFRGHVVDNFDGTYLISLPIVQKIGNYSLSIVRESVHIRGSPFNVKAVPGLFSPRDSEVRFSSETMVAGGSETVTITAKDSAGNKLVRGGETFFILVDGPTKVSMMVLDLTNGIYTADLHSNVSGLFFLKVFWNGILVDGNTKSLRVLAASADAAYCFADGTGLDDQPLVAGYFADITVRARDAFGNIDSSWTNAFDIFIANDKGENILNITFGSSYMSEPGVYRMKYQLTKSGVYFIDVNLRTETGLGDGSVISNRNKFVTATETQSEECIIVTSNKSSVCIASLSMSCRFNLTARDRFSNEVIEDGDLFEAMMQRSDEGQDLFIVEGSIIGLGGPNYEITFALTASGSYRFLVSRYYTPVLGSNVILTVGPAALSHRDCTISGLGLQGAIATFDSFFQVMARDGFGNAIKHDVLLITMNIRPAASSSVSYAGDGAYLLAWKPPMTETYLVSLLHSNLSLAHSPYTVKAVDPGSVRRGLGNIVSAPYSTTEGLKPFLTAGSESIFFIKPRNVLQSLVTDPTAVSNAVFVAIVNGIECKSCLLLSPEKADNTTFCCISQGLAVSYRNISVRFLSRQAGKLRVEVYLDFYDNNILSHPIMESPFSVLITPSDVDPARSGFPVVALDSGGTEPLSFVSAGVQTVLILRLRDEFDNPVQQGGTADLLLNATGPRAFDLQIRDNYDGTILVLFSQNFASREYVLIAERRGWPLAGTPLNFSVSPASVYAESCNFFLTSQDTTLASGVATIVAGSDVGVKITARDKFGNPTYGTRESFRAYFRGRQSASLPAHFASNWYEVNASDLMAVAGNYSLEVLFGSSPIQARVSSVIVVANIVVASNSFAAGVGTIFAVATLLSRISLVARDRFNNIVAPDQLSSSAFVITLTTFARPSTPPSIFFEEDEACSGQLHCGPNGIRLIVRGTYEPATSSAQYQALLPARYVLSVAYDGAPIMTAGVFGCCNTSECTSCVTIGQAPAPALLRAQFSDSGEFVSRFDCKFTSPFLLKSLTGGMIIFRFDQETDRAGKLGEFSCAIIIPPSTLQRLAGSDTSAHPRCAFVNASAFAAWLPFGASVQASEKLQIAPQPSARGIRLRTACARSAVGQESLPSTQQVRFNLNIVSMMV
jgi:hypothetical protein